MVVFEKWMFLMVENRVRKYRIQNSEQVRVTAGLKTRDQARDLMRDIAEKRPETFEYTLEGNRAFLKRKDRKESVL